MAVKAKQAEKAGKGADAREYVDVKGSMREETVLSLNQEGKRLRFDAEDFLTLSDDAVQELFHENQRDYWIAKGQHEMILKDKGYSEGGRVPRVEILDPLGSDPGARLTVRPKGNEGMKFLKAHSPAWVRAEEVEDHKELGYRVIEENDPVLLRSRTIRHQGKDELVAMCVDAEKQQRHMLAVEARSKGIVKGAREKVHHDIEKATEGQARAAKVPEEEPTEEKISREQVI